jgi:hypothetical protein
MLPKGSKRERCFNGLHDMTENNTWIRPKDGSRYCKECQKNSRRERYLRLDKKTRKPFCKNGIHVMVPENVRGENKNKVCILCLEDGDMLYNSELGAPLFTEGDHRLEWDDLQMVDFY